MQRVDPAHDRKFGLRRRLRLVVKVAPAKPQQGRLPNQRQLMGPVNHRLALSRPALVSAPDKKSFSNVSSPILAGSVFTSIAGDASDAVPPPGPNRPEAASARGAFQAVIWFGCTSYCWANSASVFSPFKAASATLASKDGAWPRRVRLVMFAPDPRHPRRSQAGFPLIGLSEFGRPPLCRARPRSRRRFVPGPPVPTATGPHSTVPNDGRTAGAAD